MGYSVQQTSDGGYIIAGTTGSYPAFDVYLIKTDASGDTLWTRTYGGADPEIANCVQQTSDDGYIIVGCKGSFLNYQIYLIKTDTSGDTLWTRTYGTEEGKDYGYFVQQTSDGSYIITGSNSSGYYFDVWLLKVAGEGVGIDSFVGLPETISISNYPNPFNPSTKIFFTTEHTENAEITIYNLKGQKVKTLIDEKLPAGNHQVVWDGKNENGKPVSSGIYFYKLKADKFEETRKMILMK